MHGVWVLLRLRLFLLSGFGPSVLEPDPHAALGHSGLVADALSDARARVGVLVELVHQQCQYFSRGPGSLWGVSAQRSAQRSACTARAGLCVRQRGPRGAVVGCARAQLVPLALGVLRVLHRLRQLGLRLLRVLWLLWQTHSAQFTLRLEPRNGPDTVALGLQPEPQLVHVHQALPSTLPSTLLARAVPSEQRPVLRTKSLARAPVLLLLVLVPEQTSLKLVVVVHQLLVSIAAKVVRRKLVHLSSLPFIPGAWAKFTELSKIQRFSHKCG